jgi:thiol:disulfide interchange protein
MSETSIRYYSAWSAGCARLPIFQGMRQVRSKVCLGVAIAVLGTLAAGCASATSPSTATSSSKAPSTTASSSAAVSNASGQFPIPTGYSANRNAEADIRAALHLAATTHKEVLLDFGADWCPDCVALDSMFHSTQVEALLNSDYVVVPIDVGDWNLNLSTASQYVNLQTSGIPALVVMTGSGKVREATNDGSFENARTMDADQVAAFLTTWAPGSTQ